MGSSPTGATFLKTRVLFPKPDCKSGDKNIGVAVEGFESLRTHLAVQPKRDLVEYAQVMQSSVDIQYSKYWFYGFESRLGHFGEYGGRKSYIVDS